MNHYEILYIIHPALQAGHLDDTMKTVSEKIEHFKGKVLIQSNWGKKKLAYPIIKQKFGTYIFIQCTIDGIKIYVPNFCLIIGYANFFFPQLDWIRTLPLKCSIFSETVFIVSSKCPACKAG
jgi:ribosomal protein S6